jgi:YidC/Oxa1 family membrane protein insertase
MWTGLVDLVRAAIFAGTHVVGGSLGASIMLVSAVVRLALLPLTLRSARYARAQQEKIARLQPELERLQRRFKSDSARLLAETRALHRRHDIAMANGATFASFAIQLPLLGALFSAVRNGLGARVPFLWIGDLARGDTTLLALVSGMSALAAAVAPIVPGSQVGARTSAIIAGLLTLLFLWSTSSAVALSVGAGSAVSALQSWLLRRDARLAAQSS